MAIEIEIPTMLQKFCGDQEKLFANGETIQEILKNLDSQYEGFLTRICDSEGAIRRFINIFLNDKDIRQMKNEKTPVRENDKIMILTAVSGG